MTIAAKNHRVRKKLVVPVADSSVTKHYNHLVVRPESGYKQPYLRGRNMRVGQLIYKMRANGLSAEEAAADMDLPVEQVHEAQVYYQINRELIEQETEEEKRYLISEGISLEPVHLSG